MKKEKFLQEVARLKGNTNLKFQRIELSLNEDANKIMDELDDFRVTVGELFQEQNTAFDEEERVKQMWKNLAERGEGILQEYYSVKDAGDRVLLDAKEKANDLGITPLDIDYYLELLNSVNDTKEDEDGLVNGLRGWQDNAKS